MHTQTCCCLMLFPMFINDLRLFNNCIEYIEHIVLPWFNACILNTNMLAAIALNNL
jgi:hypothetical protein